ncbi:MAG: SPOR domain-containing protein [Alphaproteobacteria bacterium]
MRVQLGALKAADLAEAAWSALTTKNRDLLGNLPHRVVQVELGDKGTWYRLQAGPLADAEAAKSLCDSLSQRKVGCMIVKK